jgi:hypothetical protein
MCSHSVACDRAGHTVSTHTRTVAHMAKLTFETAQKTVATLKGLRLLKRDDEYIVKLVGVTIDHPTTYFTDDLQDAVDTAKQMSATLQALDAAPTVH